MIQEAVSVGIRTDKGIRNCKHQTHLAAPGCPCRLKGQHCAATNSFCQNGKCIGEANFSCGCAKLLPHNSHSSGIYKANAGHRHNDAYNPPNASRFNNTADHNQETTNKLSLGHYGNKVADNASKVNFKEDHHDHHPNNISSDLAVYQLYRYSYYH